MVAEESHTRTILRGECLLRCWLTSHSRVGMQIEGATSQRRKGRLLGTTAGFCASSLAAANLGKCMHCILAIALTRVHCVMLLSITAYFGGRCKEHSVVWQTLRWVYCDSSFTVGGRLLTLGWICKHVERLSIPEQYRWRPTVTVRNLFFFSGLNLKNVRNFKW